MNVPIRSAAEVRDELRTGGATPVELVQAALDRIDAVDPVLHAMAYVDRAGALRAAEEAGERWQSGAPKSALDGFPVTIKDSVNAVGMPWRHGSKAHDDVPMATVDSPPAARLKEAGAVILGKTTMPDFGMLASGVSSLYGIVRNPWDTAMSPGGSSAGAAAGLAAGIGYASVGTDIAGSVRLPAGHCGLVALKPTQGRVPHIAPSTMRSAGPMARSVAEAIDLYRVITQPDPRDCWSLSPEEADLLDTPLSPRGLRVGLLLDLGYDHDLDPAVESVVRAAAEVLADAGATVHELPPVFDHDPYPPLDRLFQTRAWAEYLGISRERRPMVQNAIVEWARAAGEFSAVDYARDVDEVLSSAETLRRATAAYDVVVSPVIPVAGFAAERVGVYEDQPLRHCRYTEWFNQSSQPAVALPFGFSGVLPIGVQLAGPRFGDQLLLRLASWLEGRRPAVMDWPDPVKEEERR
ncbi:MAG: amidase [Nocardioidaceae bacterium]